MPAIPKAPTFPDAAQVAEAKEALALAESTETTLKERLAAAKTRAAELAETAADAAVEAIAQDLPEIFEAADAAAEAANSEAKKLSAAVSASTRKVAEAKLHVTRIAHQRHAGEILRLCDKRLGKVLKLEAAIEQVVAAYRAVQDSCTAIVAAWPGPTPIAGLVGLDHITDLVQRELYRQSARPNHLDVAEGPAAFPGASPVSDQSNRGTPHKMRPISDEIVQANEFLGKVLRGERILKSGEYLAGGSPAPMDKPQPAAPVEDDDDRLTDEELWELRNTPQPGSRKVSADEVMRELKAKSTTKRDVP